MPVFHLGSAWCAALGIGGSCGVFAAATLHRAALCDSPGNYPGPPREYIPALPPWRGRAQVMPDFQRRPETRSEMNTIDTVIGVFPDHASADGAVKRLTEAGFDMQHLSVVGKGYHTDEKVIGFYNVENRMKFWGTRGAFWGGLWGLFFGGLFMTIPVIGHVVVLGYLASMIFSGIETAAVVGGLSVFGAALFSIGIPKDSVIQYESALQADDFLVMAHGSAEEMQRARDILGGVASSRLDLYHGAQQKAA
jgi:hypothetical protein